MCVYVHVCCFGGADGCIPLTMLVDVCHCSRLLMFECYHFLTHFPCRYW